MNHTFSYIGFRNKSSLKSPGIMEFGKDKKSFSQEYVGAYRYAFNGMESIDEVSGEKNSYDFGARMLDPRIGRWGTIDNYYADYPFYSGYSYVGNMPIKATDVEGNYIYVVDKGGKVQRIETAKDSDVKHNIGYYTLNATASGKNILDKYQESKTEHVYITIGALEQTGAQAGTINQETDKTTDKTKGKKLDVSKANKDLAPFNGITLQADGTNTFVIVNEDFINGTGEFKDKDNSNYQKAAVLFHELKAHIEMEQDVLKAVDIKIAEKTKGAPILVTNEEKAKIKDEVSHGKDFYGSHNSGYNTPNTPGTPSAQIEKELKQLKKKTDARKCTCDKSK